MTIRSELKRLIKNLKNGKRNSKGETTFPWGLLAMILKEIKTDSLRIMRIFIWKWEILIKVKISKITLNNQQLILKEGAQWGIS